MSQSMSNSLLLVNAKLDARGVKNLRPQQQPTKSKLYASSGAKSYPTSADAQQALLQLGFRVNDKLIGTGSYAKVK